MQIRFMAKSGLFAISVAAVSFLSYIPACAEQAAIAAQTMASSQDGVAEANQAQKKTERWDALPLADNSLTAQAPLVGEKATFPGFTRELIQVQWRAGDPIDLYVIRPTNVAKPPVALFLYGYPADEDRFRSDAYCSSIVKRGMAGVGFVSALTGHRYHNRPMKEWFVSELPESLGKSVHDVQMIVNYLATRGDLDTGHVGMYGQGSGGTIAILAASVDRRIKAVDLLDPWGDWPDWLAGSPVIPDEERGTYLTSAFLSSVAPFDPVHWLPKLKGRPMRLQQTLFSKATPVAARESIRAAAPRDTTMVRYKDVQEYEQKANADAAVLDWLGLQLGGELKGPKPKE